MRGIKLCVLVVFVLFLIYSNLLFCLEENGRDKDNYGKIIGQVLDKETGEPVNEKFKVFIMRPSDINRLMPVKYKMVTSNSNGYFKKTIEPGIYYLYIFPFSETSKYCCETFDVEEIKQKYMVKVEEGKIIKVIRKVKYGGLLKIILVNHKDEKLIPASLFNINHIRKVNVKLFNEKYPISSDIKIYPNTKISDLLSKGEMTIYSLVPGKYILKLNLSNMGYGSPVFLQDIEIKKKEVVIHKIKINYLDETGITGVILDNKGNSIKNAYIFIEKKDSEKFWASVKSDINGKYKIVGLKEGKYNLFLSVTTDDFSKSRSKRFTKEEKGTPIRS